MEPQVLMQGDAGDLLIYRNYLLPKDCPYEEILNIKNQLDKRPEIVVYGRVVKQQRNVGFFSDTIAGYKYSGRIAASKPLTPFLTFLMNKVNTDLNTNFNGILINEYENGKDVIGAHSDNEDELSKNNKCVASITYCTGIPRKFRIRQKIGDNKGKIVLDTPLPHLSMVIMKGEFQKYFTHEIPAQATIKDPRISFTFREHEI